MNAIGENENKPKPESTIKLLIEYLDNMWEYARLMAAEKATTFAASIIGGLFVAFFSGIIIFFLSIGIALFIGQSMDNLALGFLIVALGYIVLMLIVILVIKPIIERKVATVIINALDNEEELQ